MDLATRRMVYYGLLGLLVAGSSIALFRVAPQVVHTSFLAKDGTLSIYFSRIPSDISGNQGIANAELLSVDPPIDAHLPGILTIVNLNVTIDSIMIHRNGTNDSGWMEIPHSPITLDLLKPTSMSVLVDSAKIPSENVTTVELHVSNPTVTVSVLGILTVRPVVVSGDDNLKISVDSGANIKPQMTTSITADRPHIVIEGNGTIRLTPELGVDSINGPK